MPDQNPKTRRPVIPRPTPAFSPSAFSEPLLAWYDRHARRFPWRQNPNPYWVWVCEVMSQQTRLETVLQYFPRFVRSLPDAAALAAAEEDHLMKLWEGLGYYRRAKNLQKAAVIVTEQYGGQLPASYPALRALPGIGDYTAGAIASIAFQLPEPAVDGNVLRILARVLDYAEDIAKAPAKKALTQVARQLIPADRPGDFNQALMDLGSSVCLPQTPLCSGCPLSRLCAGFQNQRAAALPVKTAAKPRAVQQRTILVVTSGHHTLLFRRPDPGLLAGLWEFPNLEGRLSQAAAQAALQALGLCPYQWRQAEPAKHIFSHVEWHMQGYAVACRSAPPVPGGVWADAESLRTTYALPSAYRAFTHLVPQAD